MTHDHVRNQWKSPHVSSRHKNGSRGSVQPWGVRHGLRDGPPVPGTQRPHSGIKPGGGLRGRRINPAGLTIESLAEMLGETLVLGQHNFSGPVEEHPQLERMTRRVSFATHIAFVVPRHFDSEDVIEKAVLSAAAGIDEIRHDAAIPVHITVVNDRLSHSFAVSGKTDDPLRAALLSTHEGVASTASFLNAGPGLRDFFQSHFLRPGTWRFQCTPLNGRVAAEGVCSPESAVRWALKNADPRSHFSDSAGHRRLVRVALLCPFSVPHRAAEVQRLQGFVSVRSSPLQLLRTVDRMLDGDTGNVPVVQSPPAAVEWVASRGPRRISSPTPKTTGPPVSRPLLG